MKLVQQSNIDQIADEYCKESDFTIETFAIFLFKKFCKSLKNDFIIFEKTIPFSYIYSFFSYYKITKKDTRKILKIWQSLGLCSIVKYHGIRLDSSFCKFERGGDER